MDDVAGNIDTTNSNLFTLIVLALIYAGLVWLFVAVGRRLWRRKPKHITTSMNKIGVSVYALFGLPAVLILGIFIGNLFYDHFTFNTRLQRVIDSCNDMSIDKNTIGATQEKACNR